MYLMHRGEVEDSERASVGKRRACYYHISEALHWAEQQERYSNSHREERKLSSEDSLVIEGT